MALTCNLVALRNLYIPETLQRVRRSLLNSMLHGTHRDDGVVDIEANAHAGETAIRKLESKEMRNNELVFNTFLEDDGVVLQCGELGLVSDVDGDTPASWEGMRVQLQREYCELGSGRHRGCARHDAQGRFPARQTRVVCIELGILFGGLRGRDLVA